jgi:hypothetical protein
MYETVLSSEKFLLNLRMPKYDVLTDEQLGITEEHKATNVDWRMLLGIVTYQSFKLDRQNFIVDLCEALNLEEIPLKDRIPDSSNPIFRIKSIK